MPEISINDAPYNYRTYLTIGDVKGHFNNKVDSNQEAEISVEKLCENEAVETCQKFLEYLEQSGYTFPELKKRFIKPPDLSSALPKKEIDEKTVKIDERKIEKLLNDLKSGNKRIRETATWSLRKLIVPEMSPELKDKIASVFNETLNEDKAASVQIAVAWALESLAAADLSPELKDKIADPLFNLLAKKEASIQRAAIFAFEHLTWSKMSLKLEASMLLLFTSGPPKDKDADIREARVKILGRLALSDICPAKLKADIVEIFVKTLEDKIKNVRKTAANYLAYLAQSHSDLSSDLKAKMVASLIEALKDKDIDVRRDAAWALKYLAESNISLDLKEKMVDPLIKAQSDENRFRGHASAALVRLVRSNIPQKFKVKMFYSLLQSLKHKNKKIINGSTRVLICLAGLGIPSELKTELANYFILALEDENPFLRETAALALGHLTNSYTAPPEHPAIVDFIELNISRELKANMVEPLINTLRKDKKAEVRSAAAWALGELAESDISPNLKGSMVNPLIKALEDENDDVRKRAVWALYNLCKSNISQDLKVYMLKPLIRALDDKNKDIMIGAAYAIRKLVELNIIPQQ